MAIWDKFGKNIKVKFENKHDKKPEYDSNQQKDQKEADSNDEKVYDRIVEVFDGEPIQQEKLCLRVICQNC